MKLGPEMEKTNGYGDKKENNNNYNAAAGKNSRPTEITP
jgi:hypothetical protein